MRAGNLFLFDRYEVRADDRTCFEAGCIAVVLLTAALALALSSCGAHPAFHPGEADPARSRQVREEVRACAEDRGWHLDNLDLSVDAQGRLILISYRSRIIRSRNA